MLVKKPKMQKKDGILNMDEQTKDRSATAIVKLLRMNGWMVASHNDYPHEDSGKVRTYWSFSRGNQFIDGDGANDLEALCCCIIAVSGV